MDYQETMRQACLNYIERHGSRPSWFWKKSGISSTHFNLWLHGERDLAEQRLDKLREIIQQSVY